MNAAAPRSIDGYLKELRSILADEDPALVQDALYDAEEYLRAEVASHPDKSEADVLELIASTYGAPDEVAAAYIDTEAKVKAALRTPVRERPEAAGLIRRFFSIYSDSRSYTSLFYMLLALVTGIAYFTFVIVGLSVSAGLSILIIGLPVFLAFIGMARVISLGEGRLLEAVTGERMPRRPVHPGPPATLKTRIVEMLKDVRTWTTLAYFLLKLPLGIAYFVIAVVGLSVGTALTVAPFLKISEDLGWIYFGDAEPIHLEPSWLGQWPGLIVAVIFGILVLTLTLHIARGVVRLHTVVAKSLLVRPG